jgi:hypothetical protein
MLKEELDKSISTPLKTEINVLKQKIKRKKNKLKKNK